MEILEQIKIALRITTTAYDGELQDLIDSAKLDLGIPGITVADDALIRTAITTYVKIHFGEGREELTESYNLQKAQLSMCSKYNGGDNTDAV